MNTQINPGAVERDAGDTRAAFLRKAGVGGAAVAGGLMLGSVPALASGPKRGKALDIKILNYALTLEYLEYNFYKQAVANGALSGETKDFAKVVRDHEKAHVDFLVKALGRKAVKEPKFNFGETVTNQSKFQATALVLENTGVAAYAGQGPRLSDPKVVAAALSIHSVEARHAAWIATIVDAAPAPNAFDPAKSMAEVLKIVKSTGFIVG